MRFYVNKNIDLYNPNLLINGDFQVWQRGTEFTVSTDGGIYTADRWFCGTVGGVIKKVDNGVSFTKALSYVLPQSLENGQTYTLSAKIDDVITSLTFKAGTYTQNSLLEYTSWWTEGYDRIVIKPSGTSTSICQWVKLEVGNIATKFVSRRFDEELHECHYYYQPNVAIVGEVYGQYPADYTYYVETIAHLFRTMRTTPTKTFTILALANVGTDITLVSSTIEKCPQRTIWLVKTDNKALDVGKNTYKLECKANLDAEIY